MGCEDGNIDAAVAFQLLPPARPNNLACEVTISIKDYNLILFGSATHKLRFDPRIYYGQGLTLECAEWCVSLEQQCEGR